MTPFEIDIYRQVVSFAKGNSCRVSFPKLLSAINKQDAPLNEKSAIASLIHDQDFQRVLRQVGTMLWVGVDHMIRVVDSNLTQPHHDTGKGKCGLCLMEDDRKEMVCLDGETYTHHRCQPRFEKLARPVGQQS